MLLLINFGLIDFPEFALTMERKLSLRKKAQGQNL